MPYANPEVRKHKDYIYRMALKLKAIQHLGGKCQHCGNDSFFHLCFHHNHSKEFKLDSGKKISWEKIVNEVDKCTLLCHNCHRELHYNESKNLCQTSVDRRKSKQIFHEYKNVFKCEKCGYDKCPAALDFHHTDTKNHAINDLISLQFSNVANLTENVCKELDLCKVLCTNCHNEEQCDMEKFKINYVEIEERVKNYSPTVKKFTDAQLQKCITQKLSTYAIADKLGVAQSTVRDRIKRIQKRTQ